LTQFPQDLKNSLINELEFFFGNDKLRINHAKRVLDFAEKLLKYEGGNPIIVIPTAIFHDVGIKISEEKYDSSAPPFQEREGPPVTEKILKKYYFTDEEISNVCEIISHHHSKRFLKTLEGKIVFDADWLVNYGDQSKLKDREKIKSIINKLFFTNSAKKIAKSLYL